PSVVLQADSGKPLTLGVEGHRVESALAPRQFLHLLLLGDTPDDGCPTHAAHINLTVWWAECQCGDPGLRQPRDHSWWRPISKRCTVHHQNYVLPGNSHPVPIAGECHGRVGAFLRSENDRRARG